MQIDMYKMLNSRGRIYNQEELIILSKEEKNIIPIYRYEQINLTDFTHSIEIKLLQIYGNIFEKIFIRGYLLDGYIQSSLKEENFQICDGFACIDDGKKVFISTNTDVLDVLCHEIAHIVIDEIVGHNDINYISQHEAATKILESCLSKNQEWHRDREKGVEW